VQSQMICRSRQRSAAVEFRSDFAGVSRDVAIIAFEICSTLIDLNFAGITNENAGSTFSSNQGVCCDPMIIAGRKMLTTAGPFFFTASSASPFTRA